MVQQRAALWIVVAVVLALAATAYATPTFRTQPTRPSFPATYTNSSPAATTTTTATPPPNAVYVYIPYGGGENDDGATQYLPQVITVVIGVNNTVVWVNQDLITHNVISETGAFYSGDLSYGQSYFFTFTQPGYYYYYDGYRPIMTGLVIVEIS